MILQAAATFEDFDPILVNFLGGVVESRYRLSLGYLYWCSLDKI